MIFVDSGAWFASIVPIDADHEAASAWFTLNTEPLITTDYVIDETLTLMKARGESTRALQLGHAFFHGALTAVHYLTADDIHAAWEIFQRFSDKGWSFTDCTSKAVIEKLGVSSAFAFDRHFRQFGTVKIVP
jgi:predicted nucleic acid-binding protein